MKARLSTDGGARGNPGPAGYGVRIERLPAYAYDSVMVPAKTPLAIVAGVAVSLLVMAFHRVLFGPRIVPFGV